MLSDVSADTYNGDITFTNSGTERLFIACRDTGTIFGGNVTVNNDATDIVSFGAGGGTVDFNKATGTQTLETDGRTIPVMTHSGAGTLQLVDDLTVSTTLANDAGTLDLNGQNLTTTGATFTSAGTIKLTGDETIGNVAPTLTAGSGVEYTAGSGSRAMKSWTYDNAALTISGAGTFTLPAALNCTGVDISAGTLDVTDTDYQINVSGDWSNAGSFNARDGTVIFDGTNQAISGSTTFYNFSKTEATNDTTDVVLTFDNTGTQTISNLLTLNGLDANDRINVVSDSPGTQWGLTANGTFAVDYVDAQDSDASGGTTISHTDTVDSGNNSNWGFGIYLDGVAYANDESTPLTGTARTVGYRLNGGTEVTAETDTSDGSFIFPDFSVTTGDTITLYLVGETEKANTITIVESSTSITDLKLIDDHVIIRADNGSAAIDILDLVDYDNDDDATDMLFTATDATPDTLSVESGNELYINSGDTFTPGGNVTAYDIDLNGTWTETGTEALTCWGDFDSTGGTFTAASGTVTFRATSTLTGSQTLNNLTFNASSSNRTFTIAAGTTLTAGGTLTLEGNSNSLILNTGDIYAQGDITTTHSGSGSGGSGTITINGTGDQILTGSGTIRQGGLPDVVINKPSGDLTLSSIITLDQSDWTFTSMGTGSLITTGSTVVFCRDNTITGSHTLNNVTFNATGGNGICTIEASTILTVSGTLTLSGTDRITFTTGDIYAQGNIVVTAAEAGGGGSTTITVNGTGVQTITGGTDYTLTNLPNLTIDRSGVVTTSGTLPIGGMVTVADGTLAIGGDTTFYGGVTVEDSGTLECTTAGTTLTIDAGDTVTVNSGGHLNLAGTTGAGNFVYLDPDADSPDWNLTMNGTYTVDYVDVNGSNASATINATNSQETSGYSGTNTNWNFAPTGVTITWDGSTDTDWDTPANWDLGRIPTSVDDLVIPNVTNDPIIPAGTYSYNSIDVQTGSVVTCLGDTTAINSASGGTASVPHGVGVTINLASSGATAAVITGTMTADDQGFPELTGPGCPDVIRGSHYGGGGGYGGRGGEGTSWDAPGLTYGSTTQPTALGSGGVRVSSTAGAGGGAIKINAASGTVTVAGTLSANGESSGREGGSGGSIWIIADTFAGAGAITANGGNGNGTYGGAGGGGRIRLTWTSGNYTYTGTVGAAAGSAAEIGHAGTISIPDNESFTVNGDLALAPGTYNIPVLTVTNSATLECQGDDDGTPTNGSGVTINATTVTVDAGAAISANRLGFPMNAGPGTGTYGSNYGGGAGHGGVGADQSGSNLGGSVYGSPSAPISLGSGGAGAQSGYMGDGPVFYAGGAVKINASGTVTINGTVSANADLTNSIAGSSGGSIWIIADTLAGTGSITANAANGNWTYGAGGGGGRIAIEYSSYNNTLAYVTAAAGEGDHLGRIGETGTVVWTPISGYTAENVIPTAQCVQSTNADGLVTVTFKVKDPGDRINADYASYDTQVYDGGDGWAASAGTSGHQGRIAFNDLDGDEVYDSGEDIYVDSSDQDGRYDTGETQLYDGGDGWATADGTTGTRGNIYHDDANSNLVYTTGEDIWAATGDNTNHTLEDFCYSVDGGSGWSSDVDSATYLGGNWSSSHTGASTFGGASDMTFTFDTDDANTTGLDSVEQGDVQIRFKVTDTVTQGSAYTITSQSYGTSADFVVDNSDPTGLANFSAPTVTTTQATLAWTAASDTYWTTGGFGHYEIWYGTVLADVQNRTGTAAEWDNGDDANLATIGTTGTTITSLSLDSSIYYFKIWAVDNYGNEMTTTYTSADAIASNCTWDNGSADGLWSNPINWTNNTLPSVGDNVIFNNTSTTDCTADLVADNLASITIEANYGQTLTLNSDFVAGAGALTLTGNVTVNSGTIICKGDNDGTPTNGTGITINAANVTLASGTTISANGQGFGNSAGPGAGADGTYATGAGHGGKGGEMPAFGGSTYGSATAPTALGSGGGYDTSDSTNGGAGGGAIKLEASGTVTVAGTISANGGDSPGDDSGGGSGGSVWIIADTLAGAGTISANGGDGGDVEHGGGGGGGRIRLTWTSKTYTGTISAEGGDDDGTRYKGRAGTLSIPDSENLTVSNDIALAPGTYSIPTLSVTNNATLECQSDNDGTPTNGSGVTINATTVTVDSGAKISGDALGFPNSSGPEAGVDGGYGGGAGHGGDGADASTGAQGGSTYGSAIQPTALGSGGGYDTNDSTDGGVGGSAIKIEASGTVTIGGTISADGGDSEGSSGNEGGGGSGGSVWIIADTLAGAGTVTSNGGASLSNDGGGGGGGRIAFEFSSYNNTLTSTTVSGGTGDTAGTAGTLVWTPIGGYTAENVIPAAQCVQSSDGDGLVTITLKVKDPGDDVNATTGTNDNHVLKSFAYSINSGGDWTAETGGYQYYKAITIQNGQVADNLTDFPMLFSSTIADLKTTANGGDVTDDNGYDIIFTDTNASQLDHEIEKYDAATGEFVAWVEVPSVSSSADTVIRIYYGNSAISTSQEAITGVWDSNYKAVLHMNDDTTSTILDSTSNNTDGTKIAANEPIEDASGQIDEAQDADGSNDFVDLGDDLFNANQQGTISFWVNADAWPSEDPIIYVGDDSSDNQYLGFSVQSTGIRVSSQAGIGTLATIRGNTTLSTGNWYFVAITSNNSSYTIYQDGVALSNVADAGTDSGRWFADISGTRDYYIAKWDRASAGPYYFNGTLDEMRISDTARSVGWLLTSFNNQDSPATFYTVGTETNAGSTGLGGGWPNNSTNNYTGASTFAAATGYTFTWDTTHTDLTGLNNTEQTDVQIRFLVEDTINQGTNYWYLGSKSYATSADFVVDNQAPTSLASLSVSGVTAVAVSLAWTAAADVNFNHYEVWYGTNLSDVQNRTGTAAEWDNSDDAALATVSTTATTVTSLTTGLTYYFKIWAVDNGGNVATTTYTSRQTNNPPLGGYTADNVIPQAQCVQATDGSGDVTISFRAKDPDTNACTLNTFEYSVDGVPTFAAPTNADSSASLSTGWEDNSGSNYTSATGWGGTVHSFDFTTKHADLSGLDDLDQSDIQIRFTVNDGMSDSSSPAVSAAFSVDNLDPTFSTWTLNMNTRELTMNFSDTANASNFTPGGVILQDALTATTSYTLTDSTTASSNGTSIVVDLSDTDFNAIAADSSLAIDATDSYLRLTAAAITDLFGNGVTAIADGAAVQASSYTADADVPALSSWSLNLHTHQMTLVFDETVDASTVAVGEITLQDAASSPTTTRTLVNSTPSVTDSATIVITLSTLDFNAIIEDTGLGTGTSDSYFVLTALTVDDMVGNDVTAVTTGMQASTHTPNTVTATRFKITTAQGSTLTAGSTKTIIIKAYDTSDYFTPAYTGAKNLTFSGAAASNDGNTPTAENSSSTAIDFGSTTALTFSNASGSAQVSTDVILFAREDAILSVTDGTVTTNGTLTITVNPEVANKVVYTQEPSSNGIINAALSQQPIIEIRDTYGNRTDDTYGIKLWDSSTTGTLPPHYTDASGTLSSSHADNTLAATAGQATFVGVNYDTLGTIYLYADCPSESSVLPDFSTAITLVSANTTTVDAAGTPISDFNITPTNDTLAERFAALNFEVTDIGGDGTATLIDQVVVSVGGTGANASTDIAWAGLYAGATQVATATGSAITNTSITFGSTADGGSDADLSATDLDIVADNTSTEYTLYIYMLNSKLTDTEDDTYTFDINEDDISTDTATSSQMASDSAAITVVTGTITVAISHLELVETTGGTSTLNAGAGDTTELTVRATDANRNVDEDYAGNKTLIFSGLNTVGAYSPLIEATAFGYGITVNFSAGASAANGVTLTAYAAEAQDVSVQESGQAYTAHALAVTIAADPADTIAEVSGDAQSGAVSVALANPFIIVISDQYGNPISSESITFAISSQPTGAGASISTGATTTDSSGQAQTTLTLGSIAGSYEVTATSGDLTGSPVTFTATALAPTALSYVSGDNQTKGVNYPLDNALVVKLRDGSDTGIPNQTVTFTILTTPGGATGQSVSPASDTTDSSGQASTAFTLGDGMGTYTVRASWTDGASLTYNYDFTATATAAPPDHISLTGPASVVAAQVSTAYTITIQDQYDNTSDATMDTTFALTTTAGATSGFYSDSGGATPITSVTISDGASTGTFYYQDTETGLDTITATRSSGETVGADTIDVTIIPAGLSYFTVSGSTAVMTAGATRSLTVTAYDAQDNLKTDLTTMNVFFSGATSSPSPTLQAPTCSNSSNADIDFGSATLLSFSSGAATTTLRLYNVESVSIKAMNAASSPTATTSDAQDVDIVVRHATSDHLKFSADIPIPGGGFQAGVSFPLGILHAVDLYSNLCDGANGATVYAGSGKVVNYTLSGTANSPDSLSIDSYTTSVDFSSGVSTTALATILYRAQATTITPNASDLSGTDVASNSITVASGALDKLDFGGGQQPSTTCMTGVALAAQPIVAVADQYGNAVSGASDQVTITGSTTTGSYTAVSNGTLTANSLQVTASNGLATFSGMTYDYPEAIYLRASVASSSVTDAYSYQITFSTDSTDATIADGALSEPATIASTADTSVERVDIFDFTATDAGADGWATRITQIDITRDTGTDTTGGWANYITGAYISDGTSTVLGTVTDDALTFGDGSSIIYSVSDSGNETFTLSIYLEQNLPVGGDNKVLAFDIDPNDDISTYAIGSGFAAAGSLTSSTAVAVTVTKFLVTGNQATVAAGGQTTVSIDATDVNDNIDWDYAGSKQITFSGASTASSGDIPECNNVDFGSLTAIGFANGENSTAITMILYASEGASIKATDAVPSPDIATADADDLDIVVSGGAASQLTWFTQPNSTVVANAAWRAFRVNVADAYGNVAAGNIDVTIAPTGGTVSASSTNTMTSQSGIATFNDFRVFCASYPGIVTLTATASGLSNSTASNAVTVVEKYDITLQVLDSVTGGGLSELTLNILDGNGVVVSQSGLTNPTTGNSPLPFYLTAGDYQFALTKSAYVDLTSPKVAGTTADAADAAYDNTITWTVYMISIAESLADYKVLSDFVYDEDNDVIRANVRLEKRGQQSLTTGTMILGASTLNIYDSTDPSTAMYTATLNAPDANGVYWYTISNAVASQGFRSGRGYFARITIGYGTASLSTTYSSSTSFDIGITARIKTWVEEIKTDVSGVQSTVATQAATTRTAVTAARSSIESSVATKATATQAKITTKATETMTLIGSADIKTGETLASTLSLEAASRILNQESYIMSGEDMTVRYKTTTGLVPTITVYDLDDVKQLDAKAMTEAVSGTGIYEYDVTFDYGQGTHTIICQESTKGTLDSINVEVISTNLDQIASDTTSTMAQLANIDTDEMETLSSSIEDINSVIGRIIGSVDELAGLSAKVKELAGDTTSAIYDQLAVASEKLEEINKGQGVKIEEMYDLSEEQADEMDYVKNKTLEIKALTELTQDILSRTNDVPIVKTWMESEGSSPTDNTESEEPSPVGNKEFDDE